MLIRVSTREKTMGPAKNVVKKCRKQRDHVLVGKEVWYQGHIWRVVSAHANPGMSAWLTLKRGLGIEALAKSYEVNETFN